MEPENIQKVIFYEGGLRGHPSSNNQDSRLTNLVVENSGGIIKNQKQAKYILFAFSCLAFILSVLLTLSFSGGKSKIDIDNKKAEQIDAGFH